MLLKITTGLLVAGYTASFLTTVACKMRLCCEGSCIPILCVTYLAQILFLMAYNLVCFYDVLCQCSFDGRVVAKLPFVPISWLQNISHRNLLGEDYTDCSFIFLYILCTMSIRQVCMYSFLLFRGWMMPT